MARRAPRDRTEKPLPEARVGTRGVFYQGGFCYIYLERGEQPIRCSDTRPNLKSIIRRISKKGYLVGLNYNPGRLLQDDIKVILGNWCTVYIYMLIIYKDTPAERVRRPRMFERNQRGGYQCPCTLSRIDLRTKWPPADTMPETHHLKTWGVEGVNVPHFTL